MTPVPSTLAVALVAGLLGCLSHVPARGGDYGSGYGQAPSSGGQGSYHAPNPNGSQGYFPSYGDRGYGPQGYGPGSYGEWPAGQGGTTGAPWVFAPGGRPPGSAITGYQFRERPEDKRADRNSSPRYRPDPDLARRSRGAGAPPGEMWSWPGAQGPAVIFRPRDSDSQKSTDVPEGPPEYPAWGDPAFGAPPWPGTGPGYFPPPY